MDIKVEKEKKQKSLKKWGKEDWQTKDEYEKGKAKKKAATAAKKAKEKKS